MPTGSDAKPAEQQVSSFLKTTVTTVVFNLVVIIGLAQIFTFDNGAWALGGMLSMVATLIAGLVLLAVPGRRTQGSGLLFGFFATLVFLYVLAMRMGSQLE